MLNNFNTIIKFITSMFKSVVILTIQSAPIGAIY